MTGSGSAVCGFFNSKEIRNNAFNNIKKYLNLDYKILSSETIWVCAKISVKIKNVPHSTQIY